MTQQDCKSELRAAFTMREIEKAKRNCQAVTSGVFVCVTLAAIFMYLIVISHLVLGIAGPVLISVLFLVALLVPYFYQTVKDLLERHRVQKTSNILGQESPQQG